MATQSKQVATKEENMPAFLKKQNGPARGSEDVGAEDLVIPRLELAQALSPAQKKKDDAYIEGCEEGDLYNNVTRELYGDSVIVCPVMFKKEWLLWRDRQKDTGGFHGAFPNKESAEEARQVLERPENVEAVDTHQHYCLLIKENGSMEEIVISMARSKAKVSRNWNSVIRINGGDRFSRQYKVSTFTDANNSGDEFQNLKIENHGWVTEEIYNAAEKLYEAIAEGRASADYSQDDVPEQTGENAEF